MKKLSTYTGRDVVWKLAGVQAKMRSRKESLEEGNQDVSRQASGKLMRQFGWQVIL